MFRTNVYVPTGTGRPADPRNQILRPRDFLRARSGEERGLCRGQCRGPARPGSSCRRLARAGTLCRRRARAQTRAKQRCAGAVRELGHRPAGPTGPTRAWRRQQRDQLVAPRQLLALVRASHEWRYQWRPRPASTTAGVHGRHQSAGGRRGLHVASCGRCRRQGRRHGVGGAEDARPPRLENCRGIAFAVAGRGLARTLEPSREPHRRQLSRRRASSLLPAA